MIDRLYDWSFTGQGVLVCTLVAFAIAFVVVKKPKPKP